MTTIDLSTTAVWRPTASDRLAAIWRNFRKARTEHQLRRELRDCPDYLLRDMGIPTSAARPRRSGLKLLSNEAGNGFLNGQN